MVYIYIYMVLLTIVNRVLYQFKASKTPFIITGTRSTVIVDGCGFLGA